MKAMWVAGVALMTASPAMAQMVGPSLSGPPRTPGPQPVGEVAKRAPINGVVILYGNERCPVDSDGNEIVICERRSAQEQFRVPKELREFQVTPENASWATRAQDAIGTGIGVNSIGSCSAVGIGGATGCFNQSATASRRANEARKAAENAVP